MVELKNRLARYVALGAAIPSAGASAAIVWSGPGPIGTATPGAPLTVDFGPGFGDVFRFSVDQGSSTRFYPVTTYNSVYYRVHAQHNWAVVQSVGPANAFGVTNPGIMSSQDPTRLASGFPVSSAQLFYAPLHSAGTVHDLANYNHNVFQYPYQYGTPSRSSTNQSYDWAYGQRGFMGFSFLLGGAAHYGWFDIEVSFLADTITIHGWAFDDAPRQGIDTGETPAPGAVSLTALALGAAGVRRSRRSVR